MHMFSEYLALGIAIAYLRAKDGDVKSFGVFIATVVAWPVLMLIDLLEFLRWRL